MKKTLFLTATLLVACLYSFAQNIINPMVGRSDNYSLSIAKIETDKQYTIVSFEYTAPNDGAWIELNKEVFIQTNVDNKHYDFVKAENIAIVPETRTTLKTAGDKHLFKAYFKKLPADAKTIDIIERPGQTNDGVNYFNFYNVSLTDKMPVGAEHVKVTEVVLPSPPMNGGAMATEGNEMSNIMSAMGPMYGSLIKSMLDAQLKFYKQPGKLTEIAKMQKEYFDALVKQGFTYDQSIKILTASPLIQMSGASGK